jgi:hypothetical protein
MERFLYIGEKGSQFGIELTITPIAARSTPAKTMAVMPATISADFSPFHLKDYDQNKRSQQCE